MERKNNLCFGAFLFLLLPLAAQTAAPRWYLDKEAQYPSSMYIAAVGEGKTREEAETKALAGVSLFFNTKTDVRNQAIREFNEAVRNNTTDFSQKTYIKEDAVIKSDAEFLGVRYAASWQNSKDKTWAALAYIDRREAAGIYEAKIAANMAVVDSLVADADRETEPLYTCSLLYKGLRIADVTEEYIKTAAVVDSQSNRKYAPYLTRLQSLRSTYRNIRDGLTFGVTSTSSDFTGRVERKIQELLEDSGYRITTRNPQYSVTARVTTSEENYDAGIFIRAGITLRITRNGKTLFSYSKNYDRAGHKTLDGAYNRAFMAIERDLEENFIVKLTAMIGV